MTTGGASFLVWRYCRTPQPSTTGIIRSSTMRSGIDMSNRSIASLPSEAWSIWYPASRRMRLTRIWTSSSSSTTRIRLRSTAWPSELIGGATLSWGRRWRRGRGEGYAHLDAVERPVAVHACRADAVGHLEALDDLAEDRELARQARLVAEHDEELLARAVGVLRAPHGRDHAADHRMVGELCLQQAQAARSVSARLLRVLGQRVAALDDPARDDAMEGRTVEAAGPCDLEEMRDMLGSEFGKQPDDESAL